MTEPKLNPSSLPLGMPVIALNGKMLGTVRECYPHYFLVDQPDQHDDLTIPAHAVFESADGVVRVSVNRESASEVDHEETVHHMKQNDGRDM